MENTLIRFRKDGAQIGDSKARYSSRIMAESTIETNKILNSIK